MEVPRYLLYIIIGKFSGMFRFLLAKYRKEERKAK